jgi:hypothetical protein
MAEVGTLASSLNEFLGIQGLLPIRILNEEFKF